MSQDEIWADIEGYEGWYQVSNWGRVRSLDRFSAGKRYKGKILSLHRARSGYAVLLHMEGDNKRHHVSRLVYQAFIGDIPDDTVVIHNNDDLYDNHVGNLALTSRDDMMEIMRKTNHPNLDWRDTIDIETLAIEYADASCKELAEKYNTTTGAVVWYLHQHGYTKEKARELKAGAG